MRFMPNRRRFKDLSEQEVLALAISSEEDDARIYRSYAQRLRTDYPDTAKLFDGMADEEDGHRRRLIELHRARFGEVIPLIRREHVAGWYARRPVWLVENLGLERIREEATIMESEAETFYLHAASRSTDAATRKLLGDLAQAEAAHRGRADALAEKHLDEEVRDDEDARAKRQFVLTWVQPGLAGLMDGSVSTLAPIFATAFATQDTWTTFLVGLAASVGAGISMGFTEAASFVRDPDLYRDFANVSPRRKQTFLEMGRTPESRTKRSMDFTGKIGQHSARFADADRKDPRYRVDPRTRKTQKDA
jgi:rubrerythrin